MGSASARRLDLDVADLTERAAPVRPLERRLEASFNHPEDVSTLRRCSGRKRTRKCRSVESAVHRSVCQPWAVAPCSSYRGPGLRQLPDLSEILLASSRPVG